VRTQLSAAADRPAVVVRIVDEIRLAHDTIGERHLHENHFGVTLP